MKLLNISLDKITINSNQPRKHFDKGKMDELKESIRNNGLIQPIIVRKTEAGSEKSRYEIIAGERRFRACSLLNIGNIPCIVINAGDSKSYEYAVLENIQREDLNTIEEAESYIMLMEVYGYTQEKLSEKLGKSRSSISNKIRLLKLPEKIKAKLKDGVLSYGHARTLLSLTDEKIMEKLAEETIDKGYSVRKVEDLVKRYNGKEIGKNHRNRSENIEKSLKGSEECDEKSFLEKKLTEFFESRVQIRGKLEGKGKIEIGFYDYEDLGRIIGTLNIDFE